MGLGSSEAAYTSASRDAGEEKKGGKMGNLGTWKKGGIREGFGVDGEVEGRKQLWVRKEGGFKVAKG